MIKHIVMWKLKEENKKENALKIKLMLENLVKTVKEIKSLEVGIDIKLENDSFDAVLISTFESIDDLNNYKVNPEHVKVSEFVKTVKTDRKVIDFKY